MLLHILSIVPLRFSPTDCVVSKHHMEKMSHSYIKKTVLLCFFHKLCFKATLVKRNHLFANANPKEEIPS